MEWYHFTFRSITPAQRGEKLLRQSGIEATLMRALRQISVEGCGYSLRTQARDGEAAMKLLRAKGVPYRRAFHQNGSGEVVEVEA